MGRNLELGSKFEVMGRKFELVLGRKFAWLGRKFGVGVICKLEFVLVRTLELVLGRNLELLLIPRQLMLEQCWFLSIFEQVAQNF